MSPELLRQIEASVQRDADREFVHYAQKDRAALLDYCRELEADKADDVRRMRTMRIRFTPLCRK